MAKKKVLSAGNDQDFWKTFVDDPPGVETASSGIDHSAFEVDENPEINTKKETVMRYEPTSTDSTVDLISEVSTGENEANTENTIAGQENHEDFDKEDIHVSEDSISGKEAQNNISPVKSRANGKQKKASFEEYRKLFLETPRITDRKTVFISGDLRDKLDEISRKLGDRKMSVSGFVENLVRHHLSVYENDLDVWKKL